MPDDVKEEIAEQEVTVTDDSDGALDSFLEDDEPEKDAGEEGSKATDKQAEDPKPEKPDGEKTEPEPEPDKKKDVDDPVYSDEIDQRIKNVGDKPKEPEPEKPKPEQLPAEPEKKTEATTKDSFGDLQEIDLPDKDITVGDLTVNLKEYKKDYPEDYAVIMAVSNTIANKIVEKHLEPLKKIDDLNNIVNHVAAKQSDNDFWGTITDKHSDAKAVNQSKEFLDWLDKQDAPIQRIAKNMEAPEDGIMVLDYYKKSQEKAKVNDASEKATAQKKKSDDLHRGTMRSKANVRVTDEVNMDDARAAFNEDD